ncbi:ribonuclease H-like domain-containing protein [Tanacetum coccineum]
MPCSCNRKGMWDRREKPLNDGWIDFLQELSILGISLKKPLSKGTVHHQRLPNSLKKSATSSRKETRLYTKPQNEISREAHDKIIQGLETKEKNLANEVEGRVNNGKFKECKTIYTEDGSPLYIPFYYSPEEIEYFSFNSGFSDNEKQEIDNSGMAEALAALEATLKIRKEEPKEEKQSVNYYVDPYEPLIPFPRRLEQHAEEALVHKTMESLKKIKINRPLTEEDEEIRMNPRFSALLRNHLPPKEQDPGSFILHCTIGMLDFNNALADLEVSINGMPLSMYKRLGIGKLKPINMVIEMADNTKCTPKGIIENLLVKIDKFIFPIDFVILDMVEDLKMPIILGRPLLATAHAKVYIFRNSISLEVRSEKVIFKIRSSFTMTFESIRSIRSDTCPKDDDFKKIDYDLFLYDSIVYRITKVERKKQSRPKERRMHWCKAILQEKENGSEYWPSCDPNHDMKIRYGKVCKITMERILKDHLRDKFRDEKDDLEENLEDQEECGEDKSNTIIGDIHDKLNDDWFKNTSEDEDDLEGILDYLEPISYDGFIDLDNEAYNKRKCKLLGMTYMEPTLLGFRSEYDIGAMKMEHYLSHTDYPIWEVIQKGNCPVSVSTDTNGVIKVLPPKTTKEILARERERKARTTLLMALLEEHLAKFYKITNAKEMWDAIKSRFGEALHKGYDRFQSILSQLEIHGAGLSTEDENQKFLRSLPSSWSQVSLVMRTKPGVDSLSFDDLYKYLRVFESDVKGSTGSSFSAQNVAFVSFESTSSTNDVSTAYGVSTSSGYNSQKENSSSYTDELILKKFYKKTCRRLQFDAKEPVGFDKTKVECFNFHNTWHFARECRSKGNQESRRRDTGYRAKDNGRRP